MDWMEEKITNFYSKTMKRRRVKIKGTWKDREIVRLRYKVVVRYKGKSK